MAPFVDPLTDSGFPAALEASLRDESFVALVLSGPAVDGLPQRWDVRPLELRGSICFQWAARHGTQERHENLTASETRQRAVELLSTSYRHLHLRTTAAHWELRRTRRGKLLTSQRPVAAAPPATAHDRSPRRIIPEGIPCPFLAEIGVMTPDGRVRAPQQHKFRQINRYLEFVRDLAEELPPTGPLQIVDCGCGKSGLTFALHHFFTAVAGREVRIVGLDRNAAVLDTCRAVSDRLGLSGIEFQAGDIASYVPSGPVHMTVSLHACDTATDAAIRQAIRWRTSVLFAVPCCQHELAPQLHNPALDALLAHGLLRERLAADATDALRAAALEAAGYRTQVLEFIELEHTPKNLLLRAVRRGTADADAQARGRARFDQLRRSLGIEHFALDGLLAELEIQSSRPAGSPAVPESGPQRASRRAME